MDDTFTIELPKDVTDRELESLQTELKEFEEVQDAGSMGARSIDPQSVMLWVQIASGVLGMVGTGVPIIQKVIGLIHRKGMKGVKVTLANGTSFSADDMSAEDLETLLKDSKQK